MASRTAEFRLGHLGAAMNAYKYAGPAPLRLNGDQDQFAGNYSRRVADSGVRNND
jgi:hypothetical protein